MRSIPVLIVLALVVAAAVFGYFYWRKNLAKLKPADSSIVLSTDEQNARDQEVLRRGSEEPLEVYGAMIRQAQNLSDLAKNAALQNASSDNVTLREGAAQAFGYFQDPATLNALIGLLEDKQQTVRHFAIEGLSRRREDEALQALSKFRDSNPPDPQTRLELYAAFYRAGRDELEKNEAVSKLVELAESKDDENLAIDATAKLTSIAPKDPQLAALLRRKVAAGKGDRSLAMAIVHLSSHDDVYIRKYLGLLAAYPSPKVRIAVIQSLHRVCPADRWDILESIAKKEEDPQVLRFALEEPRFIKGPRARAFLERQIGAGRLSEEQARIANASLEQSSGQELCGD